MRILYLSQLVPYPADAGPKIRIFHVLQYLASAGHQVTLLAFRRTGDRREDIETLNPYCHRVLTVLMPRRKLRDAWHLMRALLTGQPFLISRDNVPEMFQMLAAIMGESHYDAVHADQLWMAQYALAARQYDHSANGQLKIVLDQHNAMFLIPKRMASQKTNVARRALLNVESRNMARYEVQACRQFDQVVWVTAEDRQAVRNQSVAKQDMGRSRDLVIPISIDPGAKQVIQRVEAPRRVTFLGGLHWPPNAEGVAWFYREVWPAVRQQVPDAIFTVIGKNPPKEIGRIANLDEGVEVVGYVPDPSRYLEETAVFIVPLQAGGGMRVKIIDAWSWGLPLVSTTIGAEGIQCIHGENLLLADGAVEFSQSVISLLKYPQRASKLASAGRQTVESCYDWRQVYTAWDAIYPRSF